MLCRLLSYSRFTAVPNVRVLPCRTISAKFVNKLSKPVIPPVLDPVKAGTPYIKAVITLLTCIIGMRFILSLRRNDEDFGIAFKSYAFSWPQHYNILLPQDRLDVNDEDDEIVDDI